MNRFHMTTRNSLSQRNFNSRPPALPRSLIFLPRTPNFDFTSHSSPATNHWFSNRNTPELEFASTRTKHRPLFFLIASQKTFPLLLPMARHQSLITNHRFSNRHTAEAETPLTHSKQTTRAPSNRHKFGGCNSHHCLAPPRPSPRKLPSTHWPQRPALKLKLQPQQPVKMKVLG